MSPDFETINEIAIELGVDPSFIEKDWYAVKVIEVIAGLSSDSITPIFCGGTSLSKAYGLLKRFSEDLDFRGQYTTGGLRNRPTRRTFRNEVLGAVAAVDNIDFDEAEMAVGSNFFKIPLKYLRQFSTPSALRPELKLEFSFTQPQRESEVRSISSFIRHLHDLYPLLSIIQDSEEAFLETARTSFDGDMRTGARKVEKNLPEAAREALSTMRLDEEYRKEYERFVAGMSYADEEEIIHFEQALEHFEALIGLFE